jgi:hydroxymethylbilane synthase
MKIILGTRGSQLALWQAEFTKSELEKVGADVELRIIKTKGDQILHLSFDKIEGKGFFTKELEDALLSGEIDLAVHSMKDMPTTQPEGLMLAAVSYRENPADWLLVRPDAVDRAQIWQLREGAVVGTSSARRKALFRAFRPDVRFLDIRGNVPTRVGKLDSREVDAVLLAGAGLTRLGLDLSAYEQVALNPKEFVPAPAQGVLAYQIRREDLSLRAFLKKIHHPEVSRLTNVERRTLQLLGGGCQMPIGVYCERDRMGHYHAFAAAADRWDGPMRRARLSSATTAHLAERLVEQLNAAAVDA